MTTDTNTQIPNGWAKNNIGSFFTRNIPGEWGFDPGYKNSVLVIGTPDFNNDGTIEWDKVKSRDIPLSKLNPRLIYKGNILIEKSGGSNDQPAGRVVYCDRAINGTCSNFVQLLTVAEEFDPKFIFYQLFRLYKNGLIYRYQQKTTGIINFKINQYFQEKVLFPLSHPEQQKIAEVLTTVDEAINKTDQLIAKYKRVKQGMMQDLFRYGIDEQGLIRREETHRFKDSPLGRIPEEWKILSIADLEDMLTSGSRGWARYYSPEGALFLRIGNLTREHVNLRLDDLVFVCPPKGGEGLRTKTKPDDILISITADLGIIGIVPAFLGEAYVNQHIALLRIDVAMAAPHWVAMFLASHAGQKQFQDKNESGAKAGLSLPTVQSILVAVPKRDEQKRIVTIIASCDNAIVEETKYEQKLVALKRGLMKDLLSGTVRVNHLIKE